MSPRAYCALQCAVPAILSILDRRGGSMPSAARYTPFTPYTPAPLICPLYPTCPYILRRGKRAAAPGPVAKNLVSVKAGS